MKTMDFWNEETGTVDFYIRDKDLVFWGTAICHPDDKDMQSRLTGTNIASIRAEIKMLQHMRDHEIKPGLAALKQLYYSMNRSKKFNEKSYENIMLQRQIRNYENDLVVANQNLAQLRQSLKTYIDKKEHFYQAVRKKRMAKSNQSETDNSYL